MALTDEEIRHVARLARLGLDADDIDRLRDELSSILDHVSAIARLDLADVPPTSHPLDVANALADDVPRPSVPRAEALLNAPDPAEAGFRVPPIGS